MKDAPLHPDKRNLHFVGLCRFARNVLLTDNIVRYDDVEPGSRKTYDFPLITYFGVMECGTWNAEIWRMENEKRRVENDACPYFVRAFSKEHRVSILTFQFSVSTAKCV